MECRVNRLAMAATGFSITRTAVPILKTVFGVALDLVAELMDAIVSASDMNTVRTKWMMPIVTAQALVVI
jgi:hypothetical protein